MSKANAHKILFLVLFALMTCLVLGGCNQETKKPSLPPQDEERSQQAEKAEEVKKYDTEPTISLYRSKTGQIDELKLEDYLKGVVAAEIGPKFPMEALKAQAIVARTMTLALIEYENGTRGKHNTDASDDHTEFQAYDNSAINDNIAKAVDETRGQVLTYEGKFAYTLFSSVSKDKTASLAEGFPTLKDKAGPYLTPVATNGIKNAPEKYRNWTVKVPASEIKQIMGVKDNTLTDIEVSKKGPSGRALEVSANKGSVRISGVDLRQKVGFDRLYSTYFTDIKIENNQVVFKGAGWGHGVGMEQWGAFTMAKEGKKAKEIVEHYFPKTQFTQLYK
ncbi:MAG: SpoIID/LytB domain-containing protein [Bacillota bacterium]|nr:SpoIID/LytB domain-containing protein [Bacillota bacterium]